MTVCSICKTDRGRTHDIIVGHDQGISDVKCVCEGCIEKIDRIASVITKDDFTEGDSE